MARDIGEGGNRELKLTAESYAPRVPARSASASTPIAPPPEGGVLDAGRDTTARPSIKCPRCKHTSYHPDDVKNGYCGYCHAWTTVHPADIMADPAYDPYGPTNPVGGAMSRLVRDELFTYPGLGGWPATRRIRMWLTPPDATGPGHFVAVLTEAGEGTSITNAAETIAAELAREYPQEYIEIIEHYPVGAGVDPVEHFDEVMVCTSGPKWRRRDTAELARRLPGLLT